jgi:predicted short-subunit dehydrogenase-like oxidoreductase (DUF2520 family)
MEPQRTSIIGGYGRVGGSIANALRARDWPVRALGRDDDLEPTDLVVIAVPDDALDRVVRDVAAVVGTNATVIHTCGIEGAQILAPCGPRVAAIHPSFPVPTAETSFDGMFFGVTCAPEMRAWSDDFVRVLGATPTEIPETDRVTYHAALSMASNFATAIAGDAAELLGGEHAALIPLLRATVENIARLGPDAALTGPAARGDAGTIERHLDALPSHLREMYIANARRVLHRALSAGHLDLEPAEDVAELLDREEADTRDGS